MFVWIYFTAFVTTAAGTIFESHNTLTNFVVDKNTGELYVGAFDFIYKLDNNLTITAQRNVTCDPECPSKDPSDNVNQILLVYTFKNTTKILACGNVGEGACLTWDTHAFTQAKFFVKFGIVSVQPKDPSFAFVDSVKDAIFFANTRLDVSTPGKDFLDFNVLKMKDLSRIVRLELSPKRPKTKYLFGDIVGQFRYIFTVTDEGSQVVRFCETYLDATGKGSIITSMEIPLKCVGDNNQNFIHLQIGKIFHPGSELAKDFGISVNDSIVVGVFRKSKSSSEYAICAYSFQQIYKFFGLNIKKCFNGKGTILNKYTKQPCAMETPTDCPDEGSNNHQLIGTIPYKAKAVVTCSDCDLSASLDATVYRNKTLVFIGTKTGKLVKVLISSNDSGRIYEVSSRIPGSNIVSLNMERNGESNGTHVYIMGTNKIIKIPVEECSNRTTCQSCVEGGDPYCGWCTLSARCAIHSNCPDASIHLGYVQNFHQCINVSNVHPKQLPLSESYRHKLNVSMRNLPQGNPTGTYNCYINNIKVPSILIGNVLECLAPNSSQLPFANYQTGQVSVELGVYSVKTQLKIISTMYVFYNCSAISSCLKCTTGSLQCSWCFYEASCVGDGQSMCPDSYAPWVSNASLHTCPFLDLQTIFIPANVQRELVVKAAQLPKPKNASHYKCVITADTEETFSVDATWNNRTSLTCVKTEYKYSKSQKSVSATLLVKLGKTVIKPEKSDVSVYLYKCHIAATLCGSCVSLTTKEYQCGWCPEKTSCTVNDDCSAQSWIEPNGKCKAKPTIMEFFPKSGPVAGNTTLAINGSELGRKLEDVTEVSIGGLPCHVIKYVVAKRIVCRTNSSNNGTISKPIRVVVSGKEGFSKEEFHYQEPVVDNFEPKIGPVSGGTLIEIFGKDLDTGRHIIVSVGGLPCHLDSVEKTKIKCKTSRLSNRRRRSTDTVKSDGLLVFFDGSPPVRSPDEKFLYVPDPNITNITPRYTFPSSKIRMNVTGSNLNAIHFPKVALQFPEKLNLFEVNCEKPTKYHMLCVLPNVSSIITDKERTATISLILDGVTKWKDLSSYPQFNKISFFPDPVIYPFKDVYILKTAVLEIEGKNLEPSNVENLLEFVITIGGQMCNITSKEQNVIFCKAPEQASLAKRNSYDVLVNVSSSYLVFRVGKLNYEVVDDGTGSGQDLFLIYIIVGVGLGVCLLVFLFMCCLYRKKRKRQNQKQRTMEMQMNSLESKVAKECREAFAELQTDMTDFTTDLGGGGIHFFDFKNYAIRVLFPGVEEHVVMEEKRVQESPKWEEALRTFSQLIGNKNFLLIFIKTLELQPQFKMQDRCNVASLLVVALQTKMDYCTEILQCLLAELIRKSMSKSHPKLLLRRTECVAEKLLTNWLTFTLSNFLKDKAGKPLFMLFKAIKFQVAKGPVDAITNEARYSLSEDKLLRQSIEYNTLTVTVEFEDEPPCQVDVLDTDTITQAKDKIMDALFKNIPFSCRIPKDELDLKWIESPSSFKILKDEDSTSVIEGDWKNLNKLSHYDVPDRTFLHLVRRYASPLDASDLRTSFPQVSYSPSTASNKSFIRSSRANIDDADVRPWHLAKHSDYVQEKDDPRHSKLLSEIYLTRLLSTKGTLQQYVDDLFDSIFLTLRKNERPPTPIKFLFDFLDLQAEELNITDPEVLHTWKNNSLPLRFWVNLIKNPNFLFDVYKAPIVDSCLTVIAQLFMDACSVSEHRLGKDSPSNKLLYAKEIPAYKQKVERFYENVASAPRLTDEEIKNFFSTNSIEDFNVDNALKELYKYAAKYQDELQEALEDSRYPQLASKLEHVVAIFSDD